jgi:hypothetical protein
LVLISLLACKEKQDKGSSTTINKIIREIKSDNVLKGSAVGIAGQRPMQWDRYVALRTKATDKELLALTNDSNGVVRCYAFQALVERKTVDLFPVVLRHLSDTSTVYTLYGCIGGSQKVGDFFLETIKEPGSLSKSNQLNLNQKAIIDSLLIFEDGNKLGARNRLISEIAPEKKFYSRVRKLADGEHDRFAVVALSKYRKQQDKPLIEELLNDPNSQIFGFAAVRYFPDPSFFPILERTLRYEINKNNGGKDERLQLLYQAIVQYKDQTSRQLLKSVLNEAKGMQLIYHADYLHQALKLYPAVIYKGLLKPYI